MVQLKYVVVAAGAMMEDSNGLWQAVIEPGQFVFVRPSSNAYWRGAPVPVVVPQNGGGAPQNTTLLGILARMPVGAGSNFGVPLAVLTIIVQGPAELRDDALATMPFENTMQAGWRACGRRRVFYSGAGSLTPHHVVLQ